MAVRSITLNIGGQALSVRTDASDERVRELEKRVSDRIRDLKRSAPAVSSSKVNLLAVLTFAEELIDCEHRLAEARADRQEALDRLSEEQAARDVEREAIAEERAGLEAEREALEKLRSQVGVSAQQALDLLDEAESRIEDDA